jgi:hypothetical protein
VSSDSKKYVHVSEERHFAPPHGAHREGVRTIPCDDDPVFVLYRVGNRQTVVSLPLSFPSALPIEFVEERTCSPAKVTGGIDLATLYLCGWIPSLGSAGRGEFHKRRGGGAQFRRHREFVGVVLETFRALKKWARGSFTQVTKRLANGAVVL